MANPLPLVKFEPLLRDLLKKAVASGNGLVQIRRPERPANTPFFEPTVVNCEVSPPKAAIPIEMVSRVRVVDSNCKLADRHG
jgi:hypothetical protein